MKETAEYSRKETTHILFKGDVSGIQDFIFNVKSDGAAQELKARSFFIKLLIEIAIQKALDEFSIANADYDNCKISTSGGNFILKLPYANGFTDKLSNIQLIFTKALDATGINISFSSVAYEQTRYKECLMELNKENRKAKYSFYSKDVGFFNPFEKTVLSRNNWTNLYRMIAHNNAFVIEHTTECTGLIVATNSVKLAGYELTFNNNGIGKLLMDFLESLIPINHTNSIKTFEFLAKKDKRVGSVNNGNCNILINGGKEGIEKLGILSLDVDGLGTYLESVEDVNAHRGIDERLRNFFNQKLRDIINDDNLNYRSQCGTSIPLFENKIYSVTAGGDDSFFVGKWNTIFDFAIKINSEFNQEFHDNNLTISAGYVIVDPKFPVVRFAEKVEQALKKAKYSYNTKGNICIMNEVIPWKFLDEIQIRRSKFGQYLNSGNLTKGRLEQARQNIQSAKSFNAFRLEDFWKLSYCLRDMDKDKSKIILKWVNQDIANTFKAASLLEKKTYRLQLSLAARLAEFDRR